VDRGFDGLCGAKITRKEDIGEFESIPDEIL
jgi:hypothetical protein